jgi:peptidyl-tRNA hydrolase, PTH1 family
MYLIIGLGNPTDQHRTDRHNAGFWLCDQIASILNTSFKLESKFKGEVAKGKYQGQDIYLLKPMTYMNLSGESVGQLMRFLQIKPTQLLVIHDELDLAPGVIRLKMGGGTGGHNGLKSIQSHIGTPDYLRLRVGIGHPRDFVEKGSPHQEVASYVLKRPPKSEMALIEDCFDQFVRVLPLVLNGELSQAMKDLHTS